MSAEVEEVVKVRESPLDVSRFELFLKDFRDGRGDFKYRRLINRMVQLRSRSLVIDFIDLLSYDEELATTLLERPREVLELASDAIKQVVKVEDPDYAKTVDRFHARIRGLPETHLIPLRNIRAVHLNRLIGIEGIVTRMSVVKQQLVNAVFRCKDCGSEIEVPQDDSALRKPTVCPTCGKTPKGGFELVHEKSRFIDWQKFILQEKPEDLPPGQLPRSIEVIVKDDLVDYARPGDRAVVTGILLVAKESGRREGPPLFRAYLEANHIEVITKENMDVEITPEDEKRILELSRRKNIHELIANSIAPSIYGYKEIKKAIAALLFGGVPKVYPDGVRVRGDIHILLIGDPGVAKSQLLRYVASIAPRGIYTTGKGSTAAGLTAAVVREKSTGEFYLEAGALVLADGGVACIDEFDKMDPRDRVSIHEAMEQQSISIAKAGIVATLNARTSILAAANPAFGRYLYNRPVTENIDLPVTILSRFDLIFVITDRPNKEEDAKLARYVLDFHRGAYMDVFDYVIPRDLLKKYIAYARRNVRPRLSEEAKEKLVKFYVDMRTKSLDADSPIAITPRQLEALVRLAEAHAKMALSEVVRPEDAEAAIELMSYFLRSVGVDVETGRIDIDVVMTGKPKSQRDKIVLVMDLIKRMVEENNGEPVSKEEVVARAVEKGLDEDTVRKLLEKLHESGELIEPRPGYITRTVM